MFLRCRRILSAFVFSYSIPVCFYVIYFGRSCSFLIFISFGDFSPSSCFPNLVNLALFPHVKLLVLHITSLDTHVLNLSWITLNVELS